jgi:hypothetical protein
MSGKDFEGRRGYGAAFEKQTEHLSVREHHTMRVGDSLCCARADGRMIFAVVVVRVNEDGSVVLQSRALPGWEG